MHPILLTIFGKDLHFYQVVYPSVLLIGIWLSLRRAKKEGLSEEIMMGGFVFALIGVLFGARLVDLIVRFSWYMEDPARIFTLRHGVVLYGGFLGATLGSWGYLKYRKQPFLPMVDIASTYFGLGLFFHRSLACFMAGCCYGRPTDLPWGVVFPEGSIPYRAWGALPLHPSQLYEALVGLCLFAVMLAYRRRPSRAYGELFALQLAFYGTARFFLEFLRGDKQRGHYAFLSTSQWISLAMLGFAMILAIYAHRTKALASNGKPAKRRARTPVR